MAITTITVQDRNNPTKTITLSRYVVEPKEEPTAIIFGKFSPWTGKNGHGRMLDFAKKAGIKKFIVCSPFRDETKESDANMFNIDDKIKFIKLGSKEQGFEVDVLNIHATNPMGMFRNLANDFKIARPVFVFGPDRIKSFSKFFVPYTKNAVSILDPDNKDFGKGEYLAMTDRGSDNISGTEIRKLIRINDKETFKKLTGYSDKIWDLMRSSAKGINLKESKSFASIYFNKLFEGGNVTLSTGEEADKIDLKIADKKDFETLQKEIINALADLAEQFNKQTGEILWKNPKKDLESGKLFSGSTRSFFTKDFDEFVKYKPEVGDIDTQVPDLIMPRLKTFLEGLKGKKIGKFVFTGFTNAGTQLNCLIEPPKELRKFSKFVQVDFEGVKFKDYLPTEFSTFGYYSSWTDIKAGVKGLAVKYLLRCMTNGLRREEIQLISDKTQKPIKTGPTTAFYSFSISHGVRRAIEPALDENGEMIYHNGLPCYYKIPTKNSKYETSLRVIFRFLFGKSPRGGEEKSLYSYIKTLELMKAYWKPEQVEVTFDKMLELLWSKEGQQLEKGNPSLDNQIKTAIYNKFIDAFPNLKSKEKVASQMKVDFYKNYKV